MLCMVQLDSNREYGEEGDGDDAGLSNGMGDMLVFLLSQSE